MLHPRQSGQRGVQARDDATLLEEAVGLAEAIDLEVEKADSLQVRKIAPGTFFTKGQVEALSAGSPDDKPDLIIVNTTLSPVQQRNLERATKSKVIDRTGLILEIFGRRAQTKEGTLQVELAHLSYQQGRLVRSWTHLERQRGGVGFMGGPGETQIETDRRLLRDRIRSLRSRLDDVRRTRALARRKRARAPFPVVALVGYTNAGKSTLFNRLTDAEVLSKDMLFATLDPTVRRVTLPGGRPAMMSDTVGFISNLPTELVAAFRATLEEVLEADVLLHVQDVSAPDHAAQHADVLDVLGALGVDPEAGEGPTVIDVLNKADLLPEDDASAWEAIAARREKSVLISAQTGAGMDALGKVIEVALPEPLAALRLRVPQSNPAALGAAYRLGQNVQQETATQDHIVLSGEFSDQARARLIDQGAEIED